MIAPLLSAGAVQLTDSARSPDTEDTDGAEGAAGAAGTRLVTDLPLKLGTNWLSVSLSLSRSFVGWV